MRRFVASTLRWAIAGALILGILFPASSAFALGVPDELASAAREFCTLSAKSKGFTVDDIVGVKPRVGDGATVSLKLSKGGKKYAYECGYFESVTELPSAVVNDRNAALERQRADQARALAERNRVAAQERVRRNTDDTVVTTTKESKGGISPLLWLLPLLALPLLFFFLRNRGETTDATPVKAGTYGTTTTVTKPTAATVVKTLEALIKNSGAAVNVYSGPAITNATTGTLADGEKVVLTGRYENNWAELVKGGWIDVKFLDKDPRKA